MTAAADLLALRERKRGLDAAWLFTLVTAFLAAAVPWYLRSLEIALTPLAAILFGAAVALFAVALATDRLRRRGAVLGATLAAQLVGLGVLGAAWHLAGGMANPVFLLVFAQPVAAGGLLLPRWQAYGTALAAVAVVTAVAWMGSPDLRWYAQRAGLPVEALAGLLPELPGRGEAHPGLRLAPGFLFAGVVAFAVLAPALAVVTGALAAAAGRFDRQAAEGSPLLGRAIRAAAAPAALVDVASRRVVEASKGFLVRLLLDPEDLTEENLFELVDFADRGAVEALLAGAGGELPFTVYRVGPETRVARLRLDLIAVGGERYAWMSLEDLTEIHALAAAFDAVDEPWIVIGPDLLPRYSNRAAERLLGTLDVGVEVPELLDGHGRPDGWWRPAERERTVELAGETFRCRSLRIAGGREQGLILVHLRQEATS